MIYCYDFICYCIGAIMLTKYSKGEARKKEFDVANKEFKLGGDGLISLV